MYKNLWLLQEKLLIENNTKNLKQMLSTDIHAVSKIYGRFVLL